MPAVKETFVKVTLSIVQRKEKHEDESYLCWNYPGCSAFSPNGLVGRAFGIGPIINYSMKLGKSHLDFNARWIHDFDVANRVEGDGFNFTASLKF